MSTTEDFKAVIGGAKVKIPAETVVANYIASLQKSSPAIAMAVTVLAPENIPALGSPWPGQGGIYAAHVRGHDGEPDYYLIVPTDERAHFNGVTLGTSGKDVTGATSKSNGMDNTKALAEAGSELCKTILQLEIEGHRDFFLMSANDAHMANANVPELFKKDRYYLTSTQYSSNYAFVQYFVDGYHGIHDKYGERRACAVRRIQISAI